MYVCLYVYTCMRFLLPEHQNLTTNMYVTRAWAQLKINTRGRWNQHLHIPDGLSVVQCRLSHFIGIVFLHNFCSVKRTCRTTGSWRCSVSLEESSIYMVYIYIYIYIYIYVYISMVCVTYMDDWCYISGRYISAKVNLGHPVGRLDR